jgi:selenocysteine lyase/cysteine desulfurase
VVRLFEEAITPKTRMILACHMINLTGQILPVSELTAMARRHDIPLVIDGAHALAHFDFDLGEMDVDNYSTSLHKWLFAPHGTGLLYVRRDKIADVWPLMAAPEARDDDIRKFEEIGTHPAANHNAIAEALTFHEGIGSERKAARLRYLRNRWADRLRASPKFRLHTNLDPAHSCAIGNVQVLNVPTPKVVSQLWEKWRIIATPIMHAEYEGLRVTPNVYTTLEEVDTFAAAMERIAG